MRVLVCADRPPRHLLRLLAQAPDLIVCAGDLCGWQLEALRGSGIPMVGVYGNHCSPGYLEDLGVQVVHDTMLTITVGNRPPLRIAGCSGCRAYEDHPFQYEDEAMTPLFDRLPEADLIVSHAPPLGIHDPIGTRCRPGIPDHVPSLQQAIANSANCADPVHLGWTGARSYLERVKPQWWIHGHTYPAVDERFAAMGLVAATHVNTTTVIWAMGGALIDLDQVRHVAMADAKAMATYAPAPRIHEPVMQPETVAVRAGRSLTRTFKRMHRWLVQGSAA